MQAQQEAMRVSGTAESACRPRAQFLSRLSHELRTPLTPALTGLVLLEQRRDLPPDVCEALAIIRRNVELEANLIGILLNQARASGCQPDGEMPADPAPPRRAASEQDQLPGGQANRPAWAAPPAAPATDGSPPEGRGVHGRSIHILLVEDNTDTLRLLSRLLRSRGHRVTAAASLQAAREAVATERFDMVLSDINLPDGTGWQLLSELKAHGPVTAVALSALGAEQDMQRSRDAGFAAHLVKPIDVQRLEQVIQQLAA